ncbi:MAG: bifunctional phosphoribosyl-AMP cyclohydrolase/phosphoribosyl-ATP diphosphatase HisIE, partial [Clostridia bacterium]|nr:bifunctional phosphoribosyl-AMP cyclohydrolase/phosphoribosyl-ATP diphosphatase HisIE [Clostridia bacterium]
MAFEQGLLPVVVQAAATGEVLMVAYADREAVRRTCRDGLAWFFSRSRQAHWLKGETSGNTLAVREVRYDCDADALLYVVDAAGPACHTGSRSCFFQTAWRRDDAPDDAPVGTATAGAVLAQALSELTAVVAERRRTAPPGSYVAKLLAAGLPRVLQKVGEEAVEVVVAGMVGDREHLVDELADLWFHLVVLLEAAGVAPDDIAGELLRRRAGGDSSSGLLYT